MQNMTEWIAERHVATVSSLNELIVTIEARSRRERFTSVIEHAHTPLHPILTERSAGFGLLQIRELATEATIECSYESLLAAKCVGVSW